MAQEKQDPKVNATTSLWDLPAVIGTQLPATMRNRIAMASLESHVDAWMKKLSPEERREQSQLVLDQLTNAKLALESLYIRVSQYMRS